MRPLGLVPGHLLRGFGNLGLCRVVDLMHGVPVPEPKGPAAAAEAGRVRAPGAAGPRVAADVGVAVLVDFAELWRAEIGARHGLAAGLCVVRVLDLIRIRMIRGVEPLRRGPELVPQGLLQSRKPVAFKHLGYHVSRGRKSVMGQNVDQSGRDAVVAEAVQVARDGDAFPQREGIRQTAVVGLEPQLCEGAGEPAPHFRRDVRGHFREDGLFRVHVRVVHRHRRKRVAATFVQSVAVEGPARPVGQDDESKVVVDGDFIGTPHFADAQHSPVRQRQLALGNERLQQHRHLGRRLVRLIEDAAASKNGGANEGRVDVLKPSVFEYWCRGELR
mmetsp:Transcript_13861/g.48189  ORF Transcript_13861/g.48189 Transcript_13861/m.48189 type:complete len:331 (-) Transcript_13861:1230-2222(-)